MRFPVDEHIAPSVVRWLRDARHDVASIRVEAPSLDDGSILQRALQEQRISITAD